MEMITHLTSELNRINQGCGTCIRIVEEEMFNCNSKELCPTCQKEKETLKKVSLIWANKEIEFLKEFVEMYNLHERHIVRIKLKEVEQIKSLMEKA
jgi:thiol-disulfide isomerase/thioredoxin